MATDAGIKTDSQILPVPTNFKVHSTPCLLRCALHPLSTVWYTIFFFLLVAGCLLCSCLSAVAWVNVLEIKVLDHAVRRRLLLWHARRQDLLQKVDVLQFRGLWEFDIELNVQVTEVVVTVGRHSLTLDHLDLTCREAALVA